MTRLLLVLAAALVAAPAASGAGPMPYASQLGDGVANPGGKTRLVAVGVPNRNLTMLTRIAVPGGSVVWSEPLQGRWGLPQITYGSSAAEGLSPDGKTLVLADMSPRPKAKSSFLFVDARSLRVRNRVTLRGDFAYDALSPDGTRLFLVQHVDAGDESRYVVRAFDVMQMRLLPGRIADRTQKGWVMKGWPVTRTASDDGRWVYTLIDNPGGFPFVHALDTVRGVAHCIGLPLRTRSAFNLRLDLTRDGRTLAVRWSSGRPWYRIDTGTWRLTRDDGRGFPWWTVAGAGLLLGAGAGAWRRRRRVPATHAAGGAVLSRTGGSPTRRAVRAMPEL